MKSPTGRHHWYYYVSRLVRSPSVRVFVFRSAARDDDEGRRADDVRPENRCFYNTDLRIVVVASQSFPNKTGPVESSSRASSAVQRTLNATRNTVIVGDRSNLETHVAMKTSTHSQLILTTLSVCFVRQARVCLFCDQRNNGRIRRHVTSYLDFGRFRRFQTFLQTRSRYDSRERNRQNTFVPSCYFLIISNKLYNAV